MESWSLIGWLIGSGVAGVAFGGVCMSGAELLVKAMESHASRSPRLAALRRRTLAGQSMLQKFRDRSSGLNKRLRSEEESLKGLKEYARRRAIEINWLKNRPDGSRWMLGDERSGARCFAATVARRKQSLDEKWSNSQVWQDNDWKIPGLVVLWADGRSEARHRLEAVFPAARGFEVGQVAEYNGEAKTSA